MTTRTILTRSGATLCALLLALAAAACAARPQGSGGERLNLVLPSTALSWTLPFIAQERGMLAKHGVDAEITVVSGGPLAVQAVVSGDAEVGLNVLNLTLQAASQGQDLVNLGKVFKHWDGQIVVSPDVVQERGLLDLPEGNERVKALKGLTIASVGPGSGTDVLLRTLLEDAGLRPDADVRITPIRDQQSAVDALTRKRVDAFIRSSPAPQQAIAAGAGVSVMNFAELDEAEAKGLFAGVLFARRDYVQSHRAELERLIAALDEAGGWLQQHREEAGRILRPRYGGMDAEAYRLAYESAASLASPSLAPISETDVETNTRYVEPQSAGQTLRYDRVVDNSLVG